MKHTKSWFYNWWLWFGGYFGLMILKQWTLDWTTLGWIVGGLGSVGFDVVDRLVYVYVTKPHEQLSLQVQHLMSQGRVRDGLRLLYIRSGEQLHLSSRSALFLLAWIPLALFVVTSTTSWLAKGLVMGLGLKVVRDILVNWNSPAALQREYLWQVKRDLSDREIRVMGMVFLVAFLGLSLLM